RRRERRMATHEEQRERVVLVHIHLGGRWRDECPLRPDLVRDDFFASLARDLTSHVIGETTKRDVVQPSARILGNALRRPLRGGDQRLWHRVLRRREVGVSAGDDAEHLRREVAKQMLDHRIGRRLLRQTSTGGALITWRTSIGMLSGSPPFPGAADASAAI